MTLVACLQLTPRITEVADNVAMSADAIRDAARAGAAVIVLPELITSGYMFESREEARSSAIALDHEVFTTWREAAGSDAVVVGGFAELGPDGSVFNSLAVLANGNPPVIHRKSHLWDAENTIFTPGSAPAPVVLTSQGRIAAMICYDLEFPEMTRSVALRGAQLLVVPTNWPLVARPEGQWPPEVIMGMAAARVNHMPIACADRAGLERGQQWTSGTCIISEEGWVIAQPDARGLALAELDLASADNKQISPHNHLFTDRRTELYPSTAS